MEFEDEMDAEDAKRDLSHRDFGGLKINIEWSKRSGKYNGGYGGSGRISGGMKRGVARR